MIYSLQRVTAAASTLSTGLGVETVFVRAARACSKRYCILTSNAAVAAVDFATVA